MSLIKLEGIKNEEIDFEHIENSLYFIQVIKQGDYNKMSYQTSKQN